MDPRQLLRLVVLQALLCGACKKGAFLDTHPDQSIAVPSTIADCQALLDNDVVMNGYGGLGYPSLGETGSDDYYVTGPQYGQYKTIDQRAVVWATDIYTDEEVNDWDLPYRTVLYANVALEGLKAIHPSPDAQAAWNNVQGSALFFRAFAYYQLAQVFSPVYDSGTAMQALGLPLRKSTDVNEKFTRASVQETYDQVINDLVAASTLLPDTTRYATRPSRLAVYALLARVYLSAGAWTKALQYAGSCLEIRPVLQDYNTLDAHNPLPFTRSNPEVIFGATYTSSGPSVAGRSLTDSVLFASYGANDLRKALFFESGRYFFGWYDESAYAFCGLATDEVYLTRAECFARTGDVPSAMADLNHLLETRWMSGTFVPHTAVDAADALQQVLQERRKELLYRGLRWTDLRRLNKDTAMAITLTRTVNGTAYTLPPNDPRYVYAIPRKVLDLNPQMQQNIRIR
ncbi:RagB/SusD family nutrient uptake outer membrane protein [Flavitalea sp. BT771]|uniref:RagB/SusD family nutrient uptake outer membrane protein n=1 Tax=Flavitalea sp. BT771 TaxID=3063329 RepID=UPI0026E129A6|nr:RagB/SusD family nutrient uptake outer membrane protein [Flavitalea sp. BT771]MDO6430554.1 RagB/SusD family nutrient uptake outer membrane protein [Flavitalea sp. BT771]MDV6219306.1 RagB/SusD family nutrient uptake outer membrane protein [Flavitalea sp. BT771]